MKEKTVSQTVLYTSEIMTPEDANFLGNVFGGVILSLMDLHAYATASRFAEAPCVTASFDRVSFDHPIEVNDLVQLRGYVSYVGRTSVEVTIEVTTENILTGDMHQTNTGHVTMVALKDGKPTEVPRLICETKEDKIRFLEGHTRRQRRFLDEKELVTMRESYESVSLTELDHLIEQASTTKKG